MSLSFFSWSLHIPFLATDFWSPIPYSIIPFVTKLEYCVVLIVGALCQQEFERIASIQLVNK